MRCDGCKYWMKYIDGYDQDLNLGKCNKAVVLWDATEWKKNETGDTKRIFKEEYKDQMLFAQDGSDYHATVYTRNDFFCAHHIDKSEELK